MAIRRRGAFTLVELLVVITIIGMLMALLLPAVNAAVEAGRNTQCKNNIRNCAIAANTFQETSGYYPGYVNNLGGTTVSWVVALLPQFERLDLHQDWSNAALTTKPIPYLEMLVCPSDPPEQIGGPTLSFVANSGCATSTSDKMTKDGVFHVQPIQCTADSIVDGKSNTLLFAENIQADKWDASNRFTTTFVWHAEATPTNMTRKINGNKTTTTTFDINSARPSSYHSGGVNVAFCDTHVIFLKEEVDYGVYAQLMTPNGNESTMLTVPSWTVTAGTVKRTIPLDDSKYK